MPRKYYPRKKTNRRRRRYRRRRINRRKSMTLRRTPLPAKFCTKLKYYWSGSIDPGAAAVCGVQVFRANSCYDPDVTGAGNQPRGFDQLMTMYENCQIIGSKIVVRFAQRDANTYDCVVGINLRAQATAEGALVDYMEQSKTVSTFLTAGASAPAKTKALTYSQKKQFGTGQLDPAYSHTTSTNPSEQAYYHVFGAPVQTVDAPQIDVYVTIEYIVVLTKPADLAQS